MDRNMSLSGPALIKDAASPEGEIIELSLAER